MKRIITVIMLFIIFINNVNASLLNDFETSRKSVNEYINNKTHQPYFINANNIYFEFKNSEIRMNTDFSKGGLLNLEEYKISIYQNKTYLNGINNYWTMTYTTDKAYIIDLMEKEISKNALSKTRMTQYVKNNIKISGSGTYKDPWKFNKLNTVIFISTDETKGTVEPTKSYISDGEGLAIKVTAKNGYEYASNSCNIENASDITGIRIDKVNEDMYCEVTFKEKTYTLTYDNNGGSGCTNKQIAFDSTYGTLCTPMRAGYAFEGWYTSTSYETQITNATKVTSEPVLKVYAKWKVSSTIPVFTYTGNYSIVDDNNNVISDTTTWTGDWKIRFTSSGTLNFITLNSAANGIDLFLVGGGAGGNSQADVPSGKATVSGGSGGRTNTFQAISVVVNTNYDIKVGAGGSSGGGKGGPSSAFGKSVAGGTITKGGSGGGGIQMFIELEPQSGGSYGKNGSGSYSGSGQGCTTCEFGEGTTSSCTKGTSYAYAGGGAGQGASGDYWAISYGGVGGGGNSGYGGNINYTGVATAGGNGTDGKGGGGGFGNPGGKGGSGIVIIRNKRTTAVTTCN